MEYEVFFKEKPTGILTDRKAFDLKRFKKLYTGFDRISPADFATETEFKEVEDIISFTETEWEILKHRLECPECLGEALEFSMDCDREKIEYLAWMMQERGRENIPIDDQRKQILVDCCEGGTFFANMGEAVLDGQVNKGKKLAYHKAANSLQEKLNCNVARN